MQKGNAKPNRAQLLRSILSHPPFLIILFLGGIAYYLLIGYVISISNNGNLIFNLPLYLILLLAATSGLLLTIAAYSLYLSPRNRRRGLSQGVLSAVTVFIGSLISSCTCSAPLLAIFLYGIGINAIGVSSVLYLLSSYQYLFMVIIVLINLSLIYYSLGRISMACKINRKGEIKEIA